MSARYYTLIRDQVAAHANWAIAEGFRLVEQLGPEPGLSGSHWWVCEDDGAPESLNGTRVEPLFTRLAGGRVIVTARRPA